MNFIKLCGIFITTKNKNKMQKSRKNTYFVEKYEKRSIIFFIFIILFW